MTTIANTDGMTNRKGETTKATGDYYLLRNHSLATRYTGPQGAAEELRGNRYTSDDDPPSVFVGQHCVDRDQCYSLTRVAGEFDHSGDTAHEYTGRLQITLPDGSKLQGRFHSELNELLILCG